MLGLMSEAAVRKPGGARATASRAQGPSHPVFAAIDTPDPGRAESLARQLAGAVGGLKVGKELFTAAGPALVARMAQTAPVFLDLKFHDIPNTVGGAVRSASALGVFALNVHASGGRAMMRAAVEAAEETAQSDGRPRPLVLGVTVLTSLDDSDLAEVGQAGPVSEQVLRLASLAQDCGLDGVVCSPREIALLRRACGPAFVLMVPGIRPQWSAKGDQKRVMTPAEALAEGADYLVIGRPITSADDPETAARRIMAELEI
jgi:orotidine-5'-phosphate decarboxylase